MSTSALPPTASTTLVIMLGASNWPNSPVFQESPPRAFEGAAQGFKAYLLDSHGFGLPKANLFDLFDSPLSASDQLEKLGCFLDQRAQELQAMNHAARDVLVYFVGHGGFAGPSADFYLLQHRANASSLRASGIAIDALAEVLREKARQMRRYLVLDCCFAATAFRSFQGGPDQTAITKTRDAFAVQARSSGVPRKGTVLLCSSDQKSPSLLLPDESCTMFSSALLHVLRQGNIHKSHALSLRDVKELTEDRLAAFSDTNTPRPGLYSPDQSEGDAADLPFFPNGAHPAALKSIRWDRPLEKPPVLALSTPSFSVPAVQLSSIISTRIKYLESMSRRYSTITLPLNPTINLSLHAIFQPLTLRHGPLAAEDLKREKRRTLLGEATEYKGRVFDRVQETVIADNIVEALDKSLQRRMVVLGGPGTGKTTTLKALISHQAVQALADSTALIPIFLSLSDFVRSNKSLQNYLASVIEDMMVAPSYANELWKEIEEGQAFICLDSLDEVHPRQRPEIIEKINVWASNEGNVWVIGSRFTEYKGGQFKQGQFSEWELQPMSHTLRLEMAKQLLPEVASSLKVTPDISLSPDMLVDHLEHHVQAAAWGENPLLFSLAVMFFVREGKLPESRAALYGNVVEAIFKMREPGSLERKDLLYELVGLALWLYQSRGQTFILDDMLIFFRDIQHKISSEIIPLIYRVTDSGIMEIVARDTYGFKHRTFQEYLIALKLAKHFISENQEEREKAWTLAWSKRTYSRWTEILCLLVGILIQDMGKKGIKEVERWLRQLVEQSKTKEGDPGRLGMALALKSLREITSTQLRPDIKIVQLEEEIALICLTELLNVEQGGYNERQLESFSDSVRYLRKPTRELLITRLLEALDHKAGEIREIAIAILGEMEEQTPVSSLIKMLKDVDRDVRSTAVRVLGKQKNQIPIEVLMELLHDEDSLVSQQVVRAIGERDRQKRSGRLVELLKDKNPFVRSEAIEVLGMHSSNLDLVMSCLGDNSETVRRSAVRVLGELGEIAPINILLSMLKDDASQVRFETVQALGQLGERISIEVFLNLLHDEDAFVRSAAIETLERLGERVSIEVFLQALHDEDEMVRRPAAIALVRRVSSIPLDFLITKLSNSCRHPRRVAVEILMELGEQAPIELLLQALHDEDDYIRYSAIKAFGKLRKPIPINIILALLQDKNAMIRKTSIETIGYLQDKTQISNILNALHDENKFVIEAAIKVLDKLDTSLSIKKLTELSSHENAFVRRTAIEALGELGERVSVEIFLQALHDESVLVCRTAIEALGKQGVRAPVEILISLLRDKKISALQIWGIRYSTAIALGNLGERVPIEILSEVLNDKDHFVRRAAYTALGKREDQKSFELLLEALQNDTIANYGACIRPLYQRGAKIPLDILLKTLYIGGTDERLAALDGLSLMVNDKDASTLILESLGDDDLHISCAAVQILKRCSSETLSDLASEAMAVLQNEAPGAILGSVAKSFIAEIIGAAKNAVPELIEILVSLLDWPYWQVRIHAIRALANLQRNIPDRAIRRLLEIRHDPNIYTLPMQKIADGALEDILSLETGIEDE